ncbi:MAG: Uma2 family endonuclease, partial [Microcystaceae cyanobacterium]
VTEYWLFDPYGDWIPQQLQGFRLDEMGIYQLIPDNCSQVLQLQLRAADYLLEFYRLDNGEKLLTPEELYQAAQSANQLVQEANQKVEEANQLTQEANQKVEEANQRAEASNQLAAQEKAKADRLAEKLRQLGITLEEDLL